MNEIDVVKILGWDPCVRKVYRDSLNMSDYYFSNPEEARRYVESRRIAVRKIINIRLPEDDPRIDKWLRI